MRNLYNLFLCAVTIFFISCSGEKKEQKSDLSKNDVADHIEINPTDSVYHVIMIGYDTSEFNKYYKTRTEPPVIDLNQSLDKLSIAELFILKNTLLGMKGQIFEDAILRGYFTKMPWYQPPFWDAHFSITLNESERGFIQRVDRKIADLLPGNYVGTGNPNPLNILNAFQWKNQSSMIDNSNLSSNGFVIEKTEQKQLFNIYEQNQEENIPPFITTDLIQHQMHLFYGELENEIEELYLIDILKSMLEIINQQLYASYEKTLDPHIEKSIEESLLYYSIPYAVITNKKNNLIGNYNELYFEELGKVKAGEGIGSKIMQNDALNYSIFKPTGHYTKNDRTKNYFKALTWLQKVNLCLNDDKDLSNAILAAYIIHKNSELKNLYGQYIELKTYFSSQKEQFTLWDLAEVISKINDINTVEDLYNEEILLLIKNELNLTALEDCQRSVSLMPIEYQNLYTDMREITKTNEAPSPIDLFAALGNPAALSLYEQKEVNNDPTSNKIYLESIMNNLVNISTQQDAISMDWISTLLTSFNESASNPNYMKNNPWKRKELNAALASWIQLNQRVYLKAIGTRNDQNTQDTTSSTVLVGYVEPNVAFWEASATLLDNTKVFLTERNKLSKKSSKNLEWLIELVSFLNETSQKEIDGLSLDKASFQRIAKIGNECHNYALGLINPNFNTRNQKINSSIAYATNLFNGKKNKHIIGGIGQVNSIITIVEIEGFLYMTRGAIYSYYELPEYSKSSISQRQWQKLLDKDLKPIDWMQDLFYVEEEINDKPADLIVSNK